MAILSTPKFRCASNGILFHAEMIDDNHGIEYVITHHSGRKTTIVLNRRDFYEFTKFALQMVNENPRP